MGTRRPDSIDVLVGQNIRIHRTSRGLTQTELGLGVGVSFQQVQKYEDGRQRVGGSRLFKIARLLQLPVSAFFDGTDPTDIRTEALSRWLAEPYAMQLLQAYRRINDHAVRRRVIQLIDGHLRQGKAKSSQAKSDHRPNRRDNTRDEAERS